MFSILLAFGASAHSLQLDGNRPVDASSSTDRLVDILVDKVVDRTLKISLHGAKATMNHVAAAGALRCSSFPIPNREKSVVENRWRWGCTKATGGVRGRMIARATFADLAPYVVCHDSWDWFANLAAPAALTGGAALASYFDVKEDMQPKPRDPLLFNLGRILVQMLLLSSFCLSMTSVFAGFVTGTMCLGIPENLKMMQECFGKEGVEHVIAKSPMGMLTRELEFEYLVTRIGLFQGIVNWLLGIALQVLIPRERITGLMTKASRTAALASRKLSVISSSAIVTLVLFMLAFYNFHLQFYQNYGHMLYRLAELAFFPLHMVMASKNHASSCGGICNILLGEHTIAAAVSVGSQWQPDRISTCISHEILATTKNMEHSRAVPLLATGATGQQTRAWGQKVPP